MSRGRDAYTYILDGHTPVPCADLDEWSRWYGTVDRHVAVSQVMDVTVSTVFLGMDHRFSSDGPPILFETMTFSPDDSRQWRYATWDDAQAGHDAVVMALHVVSETETLADSLADDPRRE